MNNSETNAQAIDRLAQELMKDDSTFDSINKARFFVATVNGHLLASDGYGIVTHNLNTIDALTEQFYIVDNDEQSVKGLFDDVDYFYNEAVIGDDTTKPWLVYNRA